MPKINGIINSRIMDLLKPMQMPIFAKSSLTYFIYLLFS